MDRVLVWGSTLRLESSVAASILTLSETGMTDPATLTDLRLDHQTLGGNSVKSYTFTLLMWTVSRTGTRVKPSETSNGRWQRFEKKNTFKSSRLWWNWVLSCPPWTCDIKQLHSGTNTALWLLWPFHWCDWSKSVNGVGSHTPCTIMTSRYTARNNVRNTYFMHIYTVFQKK